MLRYDPVGWILKARTANSPLEQPYEGDGASRRARVSRAPAENSIWCMLKVAGEVQAQLQCAYEYIKLGYYTCASDLDLA